MRPSTLLPLLLCLLFAGCATDDIRETGITRRTAIKVAEQNCPGYPDKFAWVDRAEWNPAGPFWVVALTNRDGDHGRAFKISRNGRIIGTHVINRDGYLDDYGSYHYGTGWGYFW